MRARIVEMIDRAPKLTGSHLYNCWLGKHVSPLGRRPHLLFALGGSNDLSRTNNQGWKKEDYEVALARITLYPFVELKEEPKPYMESRPPPADFINCEGLPPLSEEPADAPEENDDGEELFAEDSESENEPAPQPQGWSTPVLMMTEPLNLDDDDDEDVPPPRKRAGKDSAEDVRAPKKAKVPMEPGRQRRLKPQGPPPKGSTKDLMRLPFNDESAPSIAAPIVDVEENPEAPPEVTAVPSPTRPDPETREPTRDLEPPVAPSAPDSSAPLDPIVEPVVQDPPVVKSTSEATTTLAVSTHTEGGESRTGGGDPKVNGGEPQDSVAPSPTGATSTSAGAGVDASMTANLEVATTISKQNFADAVGRLAIASTDFHTEVEKRLRDLEILHQEELVETRKELAESRKEIAALKTELVNERNQKVELEEAASKEGLEEKHRADLERVREELQLDLEMEEIARRRVEDAVRTLAREVIGTADKALGMSSVERVNPFANLLLESRATFLSVLKFLAPDETMPESFVSVTAMARNVPIRRSACHQGATLALGLATAHYPNINVDAVTKEFLGLGGRMTEEEVEALLALVGAYSSRVVAFTDLDVYQASVGPPEDAQNPPAEQDFESTEPFSAAAEGKLTTYTTNLLEYTAVYETESEDEQFQDLETATRAYAGKGAPSLQNDAEASGSGTRKDDADVGGSGPDV